MIDDIKFRIAMWLLKGINKKHVEFKNTWDHHITHLEQLYPNHNNDEYCHFCNGECTHKTNTPRVLVFDLEDEL